MQLGVNDIKRLEEGIEKGCGRAGCFRSAFNFNSGVCRIWPINTRDWLCTKIIPKELRADSSCPCTIATFNENFSEEKLIERCLEMIRTGRTID